MSTGVDVLNVKNERQRKMALKNKNLLFVSTALGLQAGILVLLNAFIPKIAGMDAMWIAFQAWAVYFVAGCTPIGGLKAWLGYLSGIIASIAIIETMGVPGISSLPSVGGMNVVMAVAVFIVVIPAIMTENLKNMVPALFIGSGAFFGLWTIMNGNPELMKSIGDGKVAKYIFAMRVELIYCLIGQIFGMITVYWRGKYEASLAK
jgi:hypothetical protein